MHRLRHKNEVGFARHAGGKKGGVGQTARVPENGTDSDKVIGARSSRELGRTESQNEKKNRDLQSGAETDRFTGEVGPCGGAGMQSTRISRTGDARTVVARGRGGTGGQRGIMCSSAAVGPAERPPPDPLAANPLAHPS